MLISDYLKKKIPNNMENEKKIAFIATISEQLSILHSVH